MTSLCGSVYLTSLITWETFPEDRQKSTYSSRVSPLSSISIPRKGILVWCDYVLVLTENLVSQEVLQFNTLKKKKSLFSSISVPFSAQHKLQCSWWTGIEVFRPFPEGQGQRTRIGWAWWRRHLETEAAQQTSQERRRREEGWLLDVKNHERENWGMKCPGEREGWCSACLPVFS